jgi:hypothetical protein
LKINGLHERPHVRAWWSAGNVVSRSQARSSTCLRTALCTRGAPLGVPLLSTVALSAGTAKPSNSAPMFPFIPASVLMLVMSKDMQHPYR